MSHGSLERNDKQQQIVLTLLFRKAITVQCPPYERVLFHMEGISAAVRGVAISCALIREKSAHYNSKFVIKNKTEPFGYDWRKINTEGAQDKESMPS